MSQVVLVLVQVVLVLARACSSNFDACLKFRNVIFHFQKFVKHFSKLFCKNILRKWKNRKFSFAETLIFEVFQIFIKQI